MSMEVYTLAAQSASAWPMPMETAYQLQSRWGRPPRGARRPDITYCKRLLIASVVNLWEDRPRGAITWLADVFATSRQTIYAIGGMLCPATASDEPVDTTDPSGEANHLARTALTLLFPGGTSLRPMETCLAEALGTSRSPAWLSVFLNQGGRRAGEVFAGADWSGVNPFVASRDEKFWDDWAYLLTVDPKSLAIVSAHVEETVDADRWAVSLALDQDRTKGAIIGLAEDAANWYPASLVEAVALTGAPEVLPVQKDVFHVLSRARQTLTDLERTALAKLAAAEKKATRHAHGWWHIHKWDGWQAAHAEADAALDRAQALHGWVACLHDALVLVDHRSGEIRDPATARWYLDEILSGLFSIDDKRVRSLAGYIADQKHQLFTALERLTPDVDAWRIAAAEHFTDPDVVRLFERAVARAYSLERAVVGGAHHLRPAAGRAHATVASLCQRDPVARDLADELLALLEDAVRTSSASECINSLLELYLANHRSFQGRSGRQNFLNLFTLWHCMRKFSRGKRKGKSPFQLAGVRVFDPHGTETDDWLAALGYPATP